jgi:hypothetical protein
MEACATVGVNHDWEEFATKDWVRKGQLLFQKQCICTRNGGICGRMFVNHAFLGTKMNFTDTEYCPTAACPAWGCKKCWRAMWDPCKGNYVTNEKLQSLGIGIAVWGMIVQTEDVCQHLTIKFLLLGGCNYYK